jgi:hypothetical protein
MTAKFIVANVSTGSAMMALRAIKRHGARGQKEGHQALLWCGAVGYANNGGVLPALEDAKNALRDDKGNMPLSGTPDKVLYDVLEHVIEAGKVSLARNKGKDLTGPERDVHAHALGDEAVALYVTGCALLDCAAAAKRLAAKDARQAEKDAQSESQALAAQQPVADTSRGLSLEVLLVRLADALESADSAAQANALEALPTLKALALSWVKAPAAAVAAELQEAVAYIALQKSAIGHLEGLLAEATARSPRKKAATA